MPSKDPAQRAQIARLAIAARWARTTPEERKAAAAKAQRSLMSSFERQVDPDGTLDPQERAFRAAHARKEFYARLSLKALQARRATAGKRAAKRAADLEAQRKAVAEILGMEQQ